MNIKVRLFILTTMIIGIIITVLMGTGYFPGVNSGWGVTLTPHPF
jgi:hypothetical protein